MKDYCVQNSGDCASCSLVNYGRDCKNYPVFGGIKKIDFKDWLSAWLVDAVEICCGCGKEIHFQDGAYEHSSYDGPFCDDCAKIFEAGLIPELLT